MGPRPPRSGGISGSHATCVNYSRRHETRSTHTFQGRFCTNQNRRAACDVGEMDQQHFMSAVVSCEPPGTCWILRHHHAHAPSRLPNNGPRHANCWSSGPETPHPCRSFMQMTRCLPHNAILSQQVPEGQVVHAGKLRVCFGYDSGMLRV